MPTRVFVDANVLFARDVRDWLFLLRIASGGGMFTVGSSEDVLAETVARFRDYRPQATGDQIARLRETLEQNLDELQRHYEVADWMVERDPGDGHVRAACTAGQYDMLLTFDKTVLADELHMPYVHYEPIHPDDFLMLAYEAEPRYVREVAERQISHCTATGVEPNLAARLEAVGCPRFAQVVGQLLIERSR